MKKYELVKQELMAVERAAWWNPGVRRILKAAPLVVLFLLLNTRGARAACSFNPTPDPTVDGSANSLRAAIQAANASGQDCVIELQAGTYTLTIKNTDGQENNAAEGDLDITDSGHTVTIQGQSPQSSIVNGGGVNGIDDRVFQVLGGANAVFSKLTIEGGVANDEGTAGAPLGTTESDGGGILVQNGGHVNLSNVWLDGNQAIGGNAAVICKSPGVSCVLNPAQAAAGGGLFLSSGAVNLTDSQMSRNGAVGGHGTNASRDRGVGGTGGASVGGGLYVLSGSARLFTSAVSGNSASGGPGGKGGVTGTCISTPGGSSKCITSGLSGGPGGQGGGGGFYVVSGSVTLIKSEVSGNHATGGTGGNAGVGTFSNGNHGNGGVAQGAGIFISGGKISIANSTLFANQAKGGLQGCYSVAPTFCAQGGDAIGGGLYIGSGSLSMTGDTVASNQALAISVEKSPQGSSSGGGIANTGATSLVTDDTLIGNNTQDSGNANNGDDVSGAITSSFSLIGQTAGATITDQGSNIFNEDPLLDPGGLKSNGGPTKTVALQIGSLAIDTGDNTLCAAAAPTGLGGFDQRGYPRFPHGDNHCDIGAFEFRNLLVHPKAASFAPQPMGQQGPSRNLFITNNQTTSVTLSTKLGGSDPADFIENDNCGTTLAANASCTIKITFKPTAIGERSALIKVSDSPDRTSPYGVKLTGEGK